MPTGQLATSGVRLALLLIALAAGPAVAAPPEGPSGPSGLPLPRFVSLKAERVNVRSGPTKDNDVNWVYTRGGLPVEIIAEYDNWRRIRDWEGAEGWVLHSLLSGRRTVLISASAKAVDDLVPLRASSDSKSAVTARLQAGVLAAVKHCGDHWCRITGQGFDGWIEEERLWGVYPGEKVE
jgi:SH3-like domain-containing protein